MAEYQGKDVELEKPFRLSSGSKKKFGVYVKNNKGNVVKVIFGDPNMEIKRDDPERRKVFRARHKCDQKKDKTTPAYWSCKFWSSKSVSDLLGESANKRLALTLKYLNESSNNKLIETDLRDYTFTQLRKLGWLDSPDEMTRLLAKDITEFIDLFISQGHSGFSAPILVDAVYRLLSFKPLGLVENPMITGEYTVEPFPMENDNEVIYQSNEIFHMFSKDQGISWYVNMPVQKLDDEGIEYHVYREFPVSFPFDYQEFEKEIAPLLDQR